MSSAQRLVDELFRLGASLRPPASPDQIAATEKRLGIRLPPGMADFYRLADGTERPTTEWSWNFFPVAELNLLESIREGRETLPCGKAESIPLKALAIFCDVLIDLPTYAFGIVTDNSNYGHFFADSVGFGWRVASSFDEFIDVFVAENHEIFLNGLGGA